MEDSREATEELTVLSGPKEEKQGKGRRKSILRSSLEPLDAEEEAGKRSKSTSKKVSFAADDEIKPLRVVCDPEAQLKQDPQSAQSVCCSLW